MSTCTSPPARAPRLPGRTETPGKTAITRRNGPHEECVGNLQKRALFVVHVLDCLRGAELVSGAIRVFLLQHPLQLYRVWIPSLLHGLPPLDQTPRVERGAGILEVARGGGSLH